MFTNSISLTLEVAGTSVVHLFALVFVDLERVEDRHMGCFLLRVLEETGRGDVGDVVAVEVHEGQLEHQAHQAVEVWLVERLRVEHLLEATLGHAVVAGVEVERGAAVLHDVAVDLDAGLEVVELVLTAVELEDLGRDALVGGQEVELHAVAAELCEGLGEEGDLGSLQRALLDLADPVAQDDDPRDCSGVVVLEVEDGLLYDLFEGDSVFVGVAEVGLLGLDDALGAEEREVRGEVAEDRTDGGLAAALLVVDGEDHGAAAEPTHHGLVEGDFVAEVVRELEDDVIHEVEDDQLDEVVLLEGLGEDHLVGHVAVLVALVLDDLVLAGQQVLACARVEHGDDGLLVFHVPVEALDVAHLDDVGGADAHAIEARELVLHLLDHGVDFLAQAGSAFEDDEPALEGVLRETQDLGRRVFVGVVVLAVVDSPGVVCRNHLPAAEHDVARQRTLDVDDVEVVRDVDAVFTEEPVSAQVVQGLVAEGLELEVFELAALHGTLHTVVVVRVFVLDAEEEVLELDVQRVALEAQVAQGALHDGRELHHLLGRVGLLLRHEVVELELGVLVSELAFLEDGHELVVGDGRELLELLAQSVRDVAVEDARHLVVDVELHGVGLEDVHRELHAVDYVDVFGVAHGLAGPGVEEGLLPEALVLDHVLLEDGEDVAAVVDHRACVALLPLEFDGHLEVVLLFLVVESHVKAFVGLRLDDLDERVIVDVAAEEHFLQLGVDVERVEHLLAQVEVLLHADGEVALFFVGARDFHLLELHGLLEGERGQIGPHLLVLQWLAYLYLPPRRVLTRG